MTLAQLQHEGPRLVAMHSSLIKPGASLWRKAEAERRFKRKRHLTLKAEQHYVVELCIEHVCKLFWCSLPCLTGLSRKKRWVQPRHIAMCVAYELSGLSTIALGKLFNRTRHMILHAQRRVNTTPALRAQADKVSRAVKKELKRK